MIKISRVAQRYSQSFFEVADSMQLLDQAKQDMDHLGQLLASSPSLAHTLANPTIPRHELEATLRAFAKDLNLQSITTSFLGLLAQKRRADLLNEIIEDFSNLVNQHQNRLRVHVTAKAALNKDQMKSLEKALASATNKEIQLDVKTDESILGGLVVNYGSYKLDFSLKSKLNELKHELERLS